MSIGICNSLWTESNLGQLTAHLGVDKREVMSSSAISLDSLNPDLRLTSSHLDFCHVDNRQFLHLKDNTNCDRTLDMLKLCIRNI